LNFEVLDDGAEYVADLSVYDCVSQEWRVVQPGVVNPGEGLGVGAKDWASSEVAAADPDDGGDAARSVRPATAEEELAALRSEADAAAVRAQQAAERAAAQRAAQEAARAAASGGKRPRALGSPAGRFGHCAVWLGSSSDTTSSSSSSSSSSGVYGNEAAAAFAAGPGHQTRRPAASASDYGAPLLPDAPRARGGAMWLFGGRLRGGTCSDECWLLHWPGSGGAAAAASPLWERVGPSAAVLRQHEENRADPATSALLLGLRPTFYCLDARAWPPPRYDAAACACGGPRGEFVALSGGRDTRGGRLHGDFWLYARSGRHWEQPLLVRTPLTRARNSKLPKAKKKCMF
jgi:hypothetical protein